MGKKKLTFGNIEIKINKLYRHKTPIFWGEYVDIEKILVSSKTSFGEKNCKYFIGYLHNDKRFKALHIMLPKQALM